MKLILTTLLISILSLLTTTAHATSLKADKENIDSVCQSDARMANCQNLQAGSGLLKCLHAYKKVHKNFQLSDVCNAAIMKTKADREMKQRR